MPKLNIMFLTTNFSDTPCLHAYTDIERAMDKYANCRWAGVGHPLSRQKEPIWATVHRVMPKADWIILYDFEIEKRNWKIEIPPKKRRRYKVATYVADLQRWPSQHVARLNTFGYDAALMMYVKLASALTFKNRRTRAGLGLLPIDSEFYIKNLKIPYFHMAPCIDPNRFKPTDKPPKYDVTFLAATGLACYPLRNDIWANLPHLAKSNKWRILRRQSPVGRSLNRSIMLLSERNAFVGKRYVEALSRSKVFIFGTSIFKYPLLKFPESMACKSCAMADTPLTAEELHFIPDWNFVAITQENWKDKLKYYLSHDEEREEIAQRGYETVMRYHTTDVRAKELVDWLGKIR